MKNSVKCSSKEADQRKSKTEIRNMVGRPEKEKKKKWGTSEEAR